MDVTRTELNKTVLPINTAILSTEIATSLGGTAECFYKLKKGIVHVRAKTSNSLTEEELKAFVEAHSYSEPPAHTIRNKFQEWEETGSTNEKLNLLAREGGFL